MIAFILNLPYTLVGLITVLISIPYDFKINKKPFALVFKVKTFSWSLGLYKNARAMTIGYVILLSPKELKNDLEHELIHVKQFQKYSLIWPFLYYPELFKKGYRKNKFEDEAFRLSGSIHKVTPWREIKK